MPDDHRLDSECAAPARIDRSDDVSSSGPAPGEPGGTTQPSSRTDDLTTQINELVPRESTLLLRFWLRLEELGQLARVGQADLAVRLAAIQVRIAERAVRFAEVREREFAARPWLRRMFGADRPARLAVVLLLCCLGLITAIDGHPRVTEKTGPASVPAAESRFQSAAPGQPDVQPTGPEPAAVEVTERTGEDSAEPAPQKSAEPAPVAPAPVDPGPVAGLTGVQMDNAKAIVRTGNDMGMPRRALIIGVATAMQESTLLNRASEVLPESKNYPYQGTGWDHDSVGLFQQRTSSGWGPVGKLMEPAYASAKFFEALRRVSGWERMRLTDAAQAVQVSAYPGYYAQHEAQATEVVDAILPSVQQ